MTAVRIICWAVLGTATAAIAVACWLNLRVDYEVGDE